MGFSAIDLSMEQAAGDMARRKLLEPAAAWSAEERTPERTRKRRERALTDFWFFDRTYFTPEMHTGGYARPCQMHRDELRHMQVPGVDIVAGPRDHAKTAYALKMTAWLALRGAFLIGATYSHDIPTAQRILTGLRDLLAENPRLQHDFGIDWIEDNDEQIRFRLHDDVRTRIIAPFSERRSVRGFQYMFGRPSFILGDDLETLSSPLSTDATEDRIEKVSEAFSSMAHGRASFLWLCNIFDRRCATWKLRDRQERGVLAPHWRVHTYRAWDEEARRPLWHQRFRTRTLEGLKAILAPASERDWAGNYMQDPIDEEGELFPSDGYGEWTQIPADARGAAWCDPNLSKKSKGDETSMGVGLFSPSTQWLYLRDLNLRSYANSNDLIDDYLALKRDDVVRMGFDGNVSQESTWSNNVINYAKITGRPVPWIEYRRYNVDMCAKNCSMWWMAKRIKFPPGFRETAVGRRFLAQVFSFRGKIHGRPDDAPDLLISLIELLTELSLVRPLALPGHRRTRIIPHTSEY